MALADVPGLVEVIERGIAEGLHLGAQVYVSVDGKVVADGALGEARAGTPMTPEHLNLWWSMTKPTTAISTAQLWERGLLELDDRVADYVPEFGQNGKDPITIRHLLTHTGGFRAGDAARGEWDAQVAAICAAPLEPGWVPGHTAGYHLLAGMTMLGEIIRRLDGRTFDVYVREEVFLPLGMNDCWVGMPEDVATKYGDLIATMHNTEATPERRGAGSATAAARPEGYVGAYPLARLDEPDQLRRVSPGGGGRGPIRQYARLYEALFGRGERDGVRILSPQTVEAITARHRVGLFDKTFGVVNTWGLGFGIDAYNMGRHCSPRSFGHGGSRSSQSFCDPEHGLVASVITNGMCAIESHQARFSRMFTALYEDLGLVPAGEPGREKEPGKYA